MCQRATLEAELVDAGQLIAERLANGQRVNLVRCGDVTDDDNPDALFAVAGGGTAGNTRFGVIEGREDGSPGALVLYRCGYKVGGAARPALVRGAPAALRRRGSELLPELVPADPLQLVRERIQRRKAKKLTDAPRRFHRP